MGTLIVATAGAISAASVDPEDPWDAAVGIQDVMDWHPSGRVGKSPSNLLSVFTLEGRVHD